MAKTLIGNIKGKNGRGITSIKKTGTDGSIDTYTITYTDSTTSTFTVNNSDNVLLQRQIVPSAAVESSATASQAYAVGDYVVVNGVLRKVKSAIARGNTIGDSNSTATTVTGELANLAPTSFKNRVVFSSGESPANSYFVVYGKMVFIFYQGTIKSHNVDDKLFTIPKEYAPSGQVFAAFVKNSNVYGNVGISNNGACVVNQISSTTIAGRIYFQICYPLTV